MLSSVYFGRHSRQSLDYSAAWFDAVHVELRGPAYDVLHNPGVDPNSTQVACQMHGSLEMTELFLHSTENRIMTHVRYELNSGLPIALEVAESIRLPRTFLFAWRSSETLLYLEVSRAMYNSPGPVNVITGMIPPLIMNAVNHHPKSGQVTNNPPLKSKSDQNTSSPEARSISEPCQK